MLTYSVAIRTLGLSPSTLRRALEGVAQQTSPPDNVVVYIARGYAIPQFRVGKEIYVEVDKGMMAQRALGYKEIDSDVILMLDDDIFIEPDVAARMLADMERDGWDLLGADIFQCHRMSALTKIRSFITSMVRPHRSRQIAFRQHLSGAFSYISSPCGRIYPTDTCAGPIMMWRRNQFLSINPADETWMDTSGFSYGDDTVLSFKASSNGLKCGVDFRGGLINLDGRTSSDSYRNDPHRFYLRSLLMTRTWWRMHYKPSGNNHPGSLKALAAGFGRALWLTPVMAAVSIVTLSPAPFIQHHKGIIDGIRRSRAEDLPPYIIKKRP